MKTHIPREPSGRVAFDRQGNATWEWHDETGPVHPDVDTQRLEALGADLSFEGEPAPNDALTHDPYHRTLVPGSSESRPKSRSLDDLRRLSEQINAARAKQDRTR